MPAPPRLFKARSGRAGRTARPLEALKDRNRKWGRSKVKKQRGSYTVEAVIVMSTIIIIIFAIISAFLLLYQNAVMYYVASAAAQEGAMMWTSEGQNLDGSGNRNVYYRISELWGGGQAESKRASVQKWAEEELKSLTPETMIGSGAEKVEVEYHNYVVRQELEVRITKEIDIPFKEIAQYFSEDLDLHVTVRASMSDPPEFIRNIDYGVELSRELWTLVKGQVDKLLKSKK